MEAKHQTSWFQVAVRQDRSTHDTSERYTFRWSDKNRSLHRWVLDPARGPREDQRVWHPCRNRGDDFHRQCRSEATGMVMIESTIGKLNGVAGKRGNVVEEKDVSVGVIRTSKCWRIFIPINPSIVSPLRRVIVSIVIPTADCWRAKSSPSIDTTGTFPNDTDEPVSNRYFTLLMVTMICPSMMSLGNRCIFVSPL